MAKENNGDSDARWEAQTDVADHTVYLPIVCKETDCETWETEGREQGYANRSRT